MRYYGDKQRKSGWKVEEHVDYPSWVALRASRGLREALLDLRMDRNAAESTSKGLFRSFRGIFRLKIMAKLMKMDENG